MKNISPLSKAISVLALLLMSLVFSACGSTQSVAGDAVAELEEVADVNGDIDVVMNVTFLQNQQLKSQFTEIEWTYFTATTPKGRELSGFAVFEPNNANFSLNFEELRFRGSITSIQGQKAMLGVFSDNLTAQIDGFIGSFLLTKAGTKFSTLPEGESFNLGDLINMREFEEIKVTSNLQLQELDKSSTKLAIGKLKRGAAFLGYSGKVVGAEVTTCAQPTGQLSFKGTAETTKFGTVLKGEGALCNNEVIKGIIGILIGWKVEEGES